jgi:hypothetical protein
MPRSRAQPFEPPADALVLAAVERALRQRSPQVEQYAGVALYELVAHLGLAHGPWTTRRLRPQLQRLCDEGLLEPARALGLDMWAPTRAGRRRLAAARRRGDLGELPESPQHRAWREARERAAGLIGELQEEARRALSDAAALLDAADPLPSDAWLDAGERAGTTLRRLGAASHCLREWPEPGEDGPDVDDQRDPADAALGDDERRRLRRLRAGRRNVWRWDPDDRGA